MTEYQLTSWRELPSLVVARAGGDQAGDTVKVPLPQRFQEAIDEAAMTAGLVRSDDYLAEWRRETRECGPDLAREVDAEAGRLESVFTLEALQRIVGDGGSAGSAPA